MSALYLVSTPIGYLEDITLRALKILGEVDLIAAEDTRTARQLLSAHGLHGRLLSFHQGNQRARLPQLLGALGEGKDVALVSEAGTPGISDPGYELVAAALEKGIPIVPIPGPSAVLSALSVSGLPTNQFLYLGFLPRRKGERRKLLSSLAEEGRTLVAFEAPHRLRDSLTDILETLGDRRIAVCRELTKLHEEVFRGRVSQALEHFQQPRGECTLVIEGREKEKTLPGLSPKLTAEMRRLKKKGLPAREALSQLAQATGLPRRELYRAWLKLGQVL
ncbi:MAG: 16S rRNA (cytidine(1402)-2'-O)-methyltransferase [Chloroflexi bacterium]|nr:16S rRNA (cytidine(1402)-2'-O)-methyltransferase [Chloroflexota bacterium]